MSYEQLKLGNQLCFPVYTASRLITREYQPLLEKLGITYPQYLVLLVLWEKDRCPVSEITGQLLLNTNTVTPLLKRMETMGILRREHSAKDERQVIVSLTAKGKGLQKQAAGIPGKLANSLLMGPMKIGELVQLRDQLNILITFLEEKNRLEK